jgi:two-component system response regulator
MTASSCAELVILLVEDNPGDVFMIREALEDAGIGHCLHVVSDGFQAMAFLRRQSQYAQAPRPDLVILDLNLPGKHGREVMGEMQADKDLVVLPVAVFTTSLSESGICGQYPGLRGMFAVKTPDADELIVLVREFESFARRRDKV